VLGPAVAKYIVPPVLGGGWLAALALPRHRNCRDL
jgi:hypothetical protein